MSGRAIPDGIMSRSWRPCENGMRGIELSSAIKIRQKYRQLRRPGSTDRLLRRTGVAVFALNCPNPCRDCATARGEIRLQCNILRRRMILRGTGRPLEKGRGPRAGV